MNAVLVLEEIPKTLTVTAPTLMNVRMVFITVPYLVDFVKINLVLLTVPAVSKVS